MQDRVASARARAHLAPGTAVGVDEAMIEALVRGFYDRVRADPQLGPVFDREIADWEPHLLRMIDFWSSVTLMTGRFKGQPMAVHLRMPGLERPLFERWLSLFEATARAVCPPDAAELFLAKARNIAESFQLGIAVSRGELPPPIARG